MSFKLNDVDHQFLDYIRTEMEPSDVVEHSNGWAGCAAGKWYHSLTGNSIQDGSIQLTEGLGMSIQVEELLNRSFGTETAAHLVTRIEGLES